MWSLFYHYFILREDSSPKLVITKPSIRLQFSINSMVQNHKHWLSILTLTNKQVSWMRVGMHKSLFKDHMIETMRNQIWKLFEIDTLLFHFFHVCNWSALFIRHYKNSLTCVVLIDVRYFHPYVILKDLTATFRILSFDTKVKLSWQTNTKLFCKPSILEIREEWAS